MTLRCYLHQPKVAFAALVDLHGNAPVYPQIEVDFKAAYSGHYSAIRPGMTVLYGTAPGKDDLGRNRIARLSADFPTFRTEVGRFSQGIGDGEVTLVENSHMTILEDYRVWAKIPQFLGGAIWKDGAVAAFGDVDRPRPVANGGAGTAGLVDAAGWLTVTFDASKSWAFSTAASPPVVGAASFLWEVSDVPGRYEVVSGSLTSAVVTLRFKKGFFYVYLTVTGGDFGQTHTCQVPVFACDPSDPTYAGVPNFQVRSHTHTMVGQEVSIEFYTPIPRDQYPDGTLMMLWDDDAFTHAGLYDPRNRQHVQFIGWHQNDEAHVRAEPTATLHSTTLTFYDVNKRLEALPGFSQVVEYKANPTQWTATKFPNLTYYCWYLLYWHSTACEVADLQVDRATVMTTMEFAAVGSDRSNLYAQVEAIAMFCNPDHHFTCSRQGEMRLVIDPMVQNVADRGTTVWDGFDDSKWTEVTYTYTRPPRVGQIRTMAMLAGRDYIVVDGKNTIEVIACDAPGEAIGQGEQDLENNEKITVSQFSLNVVEGNRHARVNARYGRFNITVPLEQMYAGLDLSIPYWVTLTISDANKSERELPASFTAQRGLVMEMSITYDYQATGLDRSVSLSWEMETSGKPALTHVLWPDVPAAAPAAAAAAREARQ